METVQHVETELLMRNRFAQAISLKNKNYTEGRSCPKVLFIGWFGDPANSLIEMFLKHGCEVYLFMDGATNLLLPYNMPGVDIHYIPNGHFETVTGPLGDVNINTRHFKLENILADFNQRFDMIFHCQDWNIIESDGKSDIPYFYYWTEMFVPYVPKAATHVICLNPKAVDLCRLYYRNQYIYITMPFALRECFTAMISSHPERFTPGAQPRPLQGSFAGKIYGFNFYKDRPLIVKHLKDNVHGFQTWCPSFKYNDQYSAENRQLPPIGVDKSLSWPAYMGVLSRSKWGLNIPSPLSPNFRDFEIPACGAMLLTRETPGLKELGFKDGKNCFTYKTKEEAAEIAKHDYDRSIAFEGWYLVMQQHTWQRRFEPFWKIIEKRI